MSSMYSKLVNSSANEQKKRTHNNSGVHWISSDGDLVKCSRCGYEMNRQRAIQRNRCPFCKYEIAKD